MRSGSYETMLFCLFAARQIANLRGDAQSQALGEMLTLIDGDAPLASVTERLMKAEGSQAR